jgi:hypothetical protein
VSDSTQPPTIAGIGPQVTQVNKPTGLLTFIVGDKETPVANLVVTAVSSNPTVVPNSGSNIVVTTSVSNPAQRNIVITPAANQSGVTLITVTVTDASNKSTPTTFSLNVTTVTVANDFNGDGSPDIIFEDNNGFLAAWFMNGDDVSNTTLLSPNNVGDKNWRVVDSGDFNGDGKPDLLFQHADGTLAIWTMTNTTQLSASMLSPNNAGPGWKAIAVGDFDQDGHPDILFQYTPDGSLGIWYMNGTSLVNPAMLKPASPGAAWSAVGVGDFNRDGNLDILLQNTDGTLKIWYLFNKDNLLLSSPLAGGDPNWRVVGTVDLNGDKKTDILFQNRGDSSLAVWYLDYLNNAPKVVFAKVLTSVPGATWQVVAP